MMERLKDAVCQLVSIAEEQIQREYFDELDNAGVSIMNCLDELKAYRDAEEQGLLLKLPYPVGTPIYHVFKSQGVVKDRIRSWRYGNKGLLFCSRGNSLVPEAIGRSVFLTREEAEQALEKMKG